MNISITQACKNLLVNSIENGKLDISWELDTDALKSICTNNGITKFFTFNEIIDFDIEIDTANTFDTLNLQTYTFRNIEQVYNGNIVYSCVIPFNKEQTSGSTTYYLRIKISDITSAYITEFENEINTLQINFHDTWSDTLTIEINKDYTKDLIDLMYTLVADFNSYNKEIKSANFYYIMQTFAVPLMKSFRCLTNEKNNICLRNANPDSLNDSFGNLAKFNLPLTLSLEEYRRVLQNLLLAYQNGGSESYISNVIKYFIGYTPQFSSFTDFYSWILRNNSDNEDPTNPGYFNPNSNYYLYSSTYAGVKQKNSILLLSSNFKKFIFLVSSDNYFNLTIDTTSITTILNKLKPIYTKYYTNFTNQYLQSTRTLNINSTPSDATIIINGSVRSFITLEKGSSYVWSVSKNGYISQNGSGILDDNTNLNISLKETMLEGVMLVSDDIPFLVDNNDTVLTF